MGVTHAHRIVHPLPRVRTRFSRSHSRTVYNRRCHRLTVTEEQQTAKRTVFDPLSLSVFRSQNFRSKSHLGLKLKSAERSAKTTT